MTPGENEVVSAQVVLRSAGGPRLPHGVTAENVRNLAPPPGAVALARKAFEENGFSVTSVVGNSFSITGPVQLFQDRLHTRIERESATGALKATHPDGSVACELPTGALPSEVRSIIETVTFTPPPDFGPSNF